MLAKYRKARRLGRKKYAPPRTVTNCGKPLQRSLNPLSRGIENVAGIRAACNRLPISHHRITLFTHPIKLSAHQPRALHKLKLPRDIRVDTNEM